MASEKYSSIDPLLAAKKPQWVADAFEQSRIASYGLYESIYWNIKTAFKLIERGTANKPVYMPKPMTIVETLHRYLANEMQVAIDSNFGTESEQQQGLAYITDLLRRERFYSKFSNAKRFGIMKGDWLFHILANDELPAGSRISLQTVQPENVFKITDPENVDIVIGYHIANYFVENSEGRVRRLTYRKTTGTNGPSQISVSEGIFKSDDWGGPGMDADAKPIKTTLQEKFLPPEIDQLPIYHIRNFEEAGDAWGSSELRGFEEIIGAMNQTMTDEGLMLALEGLGVYTTDAGQPVDENEEPVPWNLGPGRVVEVPQGSFFSRVDGVKSVLPMQDHYNIIAKSVDDAVGQPSITRGEVEVQVAESGVALAIRYAPMRSRVGEKNLTITDVMTNIFYDLRKWVRAYEKNGILESVRFIPTYGDIIPENKKQKFDNIMLMATAVPPIIDSSTAREMLRELGYKIPGDTEVLDRLLSDTQLFASAEADIAGQRLDTELQTQVDQTDSNQQ